MTFLLIFLLFNPVYRLYERLGFTERACRVERQVERKVNEESKSYHEQERYMNHPERAIALNGFLCRYSYIWNLEYIVWFYPSEDGLHTALVELALVVAPRASFVIWSIG